MTNLLKLLEKRNKKQQAILMKKKNITLIALTLILSSCFPSSSDEEAKITDGDRTLTIEKANYKVVFDKGALTENKYMVFGISANNEKLWKYRDGFIAPLPLARVNSLLKQYPRMDYCGGEGNSIVQDETLTFVLVGSSDLVQLHMEQAEKANAEALKNQGKRICLSIKAYPLTIKEMTYKGMTARMISNVREDHIYPKEINVISCSSL